MKSFLQFPSLDTANGNYTQAHVQLPANILDAFIPGYSTISRLLLETFGFDITLIVSISFFVFALIQSSTFLYSRFVDLVMRFGTCHVLIAVSQLFKVQVTSCYAFYKQKVCLGIRVLSVQADICNSKSDVDTYTYFMDWLGDRGVGLKARSLIALPPSRKRGFENIPGMDPHQGFLPAGGEQGTYRKALKPQRYEPALGLPEYFWYKVSLFCYS